VSVSENLNQEITVKISLRVAQIFLHSHQAPTKRIEELKKIFSWKKKETFEGVKNFSTVCVE
jgi:hypothetical protein